MLLLFSISLVYREFLYNPNNSNTVNYIYIQIYKQAPPIDFTKYIEWYVRIWAFLYTTALNPS